MSEYARLGESDARLRWMGVRPHQALLALASAGLVLLGLFGAAPLAWCGVVATLVAAMIMPWGVADTCGELALYALAFGARERWRHVRVLDVDDHAVIIAGGTATAHCFELEHRGRLDLNQGREQLGDALRELAEALASRDATSRFSLHVVAGQSRTSTLLALAPDVASPPGWRDVKVPTEVVSSSKILERWTYLRSEGRVVRTFRVFDFGGVRSSRPLLESWQRECRDATLSLHVEVLGVVKGRRVSARAAHQFESDVAAASAAGFRRSARTSRRQLRVVQREALVAQGRALVRTGLYVTFEAPSLWALRQRERTLWRSAHDAGLRLERGWGRQFAWWSAQLPGGPSW